MRDDMKNERPAWPFTSYGHERGRGCDLLGDFSFEEVRTMLALGRPNQMRW